MLIKVKMPTILTFMNRINFKLSMEKSFIILGPDQTVHSSFWLNNLKKCCAIRKPVYFICDKCRPDALPRSLISTLLLLGFFRQRVWFLSFYSQKFRKLADLESDCLKIVAKTKRDTDQLNCNRAADDAADLRLRVRKCKKKAFTWRVPNKSRACGCLSPMKQQKSNYNDRTERPGRTK